MPRVETRYGQFEIPDHAGDLIGQFLSRYGEWAWDEVVFVASNLAPGARVLDVGAFLGTFGLGLGLRQQLASICYVEANPNVTPLLRENIRRLKRQPSQVVAAMVYAGGEPPALGHIDEDNWGALSFAPTASGELFTQRPESSVTLAELRELYGPFDLIKLDVEGMERELIESDAEFFRSGRCQLWLECNEEASSLELVDVLRGLSLDVYYFAFPSHNPDNERGDHEAILPFAFEAGLLAGRHLSPVLNEQLLAHGCILRPIHSAEDLRQALWQTPRWGMKEWEARSASEIAALAGRALIGQEYSGFLRPGAAASDWRGALALADRLRQSEAQRVAYAAALERNWDGDREGAIRDFVEREGALRAQLQVQIEARARLEGEAEAHDRELRGCEGQLRALEARLSEVRVTASERLFQLTILASRIREAEAAAADANVQLLRAEQEKMERAAAFTAFEQELRQACNVPGDTPRRTLKGGVKKTKFYRKKFRPFVKKVRRLFGGKISGSK